MRSIYVLVSMNRAYFEGIGDLEEAKDKI